jgi:hypothetical protein
VHQNTHVIDGPSNWGDTYQLGDVFADVVAVLVGLLAECHGRVAPEILASGVNSSKSSDTGTVVDVDEMIRESGRTVWIRSISELLVVCGQVEYLRTTCYVSICRIVPWHSVQ